MASDRSADAWDSLWDIPAGAVVDPPPLPVKPAVVRRVAPAPRGRADHQHGHATARSSSSISLPVVRVCGGGSIAAGPPTAAPAQCGLVSEAQAGQRTTLVSGAACALLATSASEEVHAAFPCGSDVEPTSSGGSMPYLPCSPAAAPMLARPSVTSWPALAQLGASTDAQPAVETPVTPNVIPNIITTSSGDFMGSGGSSSGSVSSLATAAVFPAAYATAAVASLPPSDAASAAPCSGSRCSSSINAGVGSSINAVPPGECSSASGDRSKARSTSSTTGSANDAQLPAAPGPVAVPVRSGMIVGAPEEGTAGATYQSAVIAAGINFAAAAAVAVNSAAAIDAGRTESGSDSELLLHGVVQQTASAAAATAAAAKASASAAAAAAPLLAQPAAVSVAVADCGAAAKAAIAAMDLDTDPAPVLAAAGQAAGREMGLRQPALSPPPPALTPPHGLWTAAALREVCRSRDPRKAPSPPPLPLPSADAPAVAPPAPPAGAVATAPRDGASAWQTVGGGGGGGAFVRQQLEKSAVAPAAAQPSAAAAAARVAATAAAVLPPLRRDLKTTTALLLSRVRPVRPDPIAPPTPARRAKRSAGVGGKGKRGGKQRSKAEEWLADTGSLQAAALGRGAATATATGNGSGGGAAATSDEECFMEMLPDVILAPPPPRSMMAAGAFTGGAGGAATLLDDVQRALEAAEAPLFTSAASGASKASAEATRRVAGGAATWHPQRIWPLPPPRGRFDFRVRKRRARAATPGVSPLLPVERSAATARAAGDKKGFSLSAALHDRCCGGPTAASGGGHAAGQKRTAADLSDTDGAAPPTAAANSTTAFTSLEEALEKWRAYRGPTVRKTVEAFLRRNLLEELAARCPTSVLDLEDVPGLPRPWIRQYGQEVLDVCRNYVHVSAAQAAAAKAAAAAERRARHVAAAAMAAPPEHSGLAGPSVGSWFTGAAAAAAAASGMPRAATYIPSSGAAAGIGPPAKRQRAPGQTGDSPPSASLPSSPSRSPGSPESPRWEDAASERMRRQLLGAMGLQADEPLEHQLSCDATAEHVALLCRAGLSGGSSPTLRRSPSPGLGQQQQQTQQQQQQQQHDNPPAAAAAGSADGTAGVARTRGVTKASIAAARRARAAGGSASLPPAVGGVGAVGGAGAFGAAAAAVGSRDDSDASGSDASGSVSPRAAVVAAGQPYSPASSPPASSPISTLAAGRTTPSWPPPPPSRRAAAAAAMARLGGASGWVAAPPGVRVRHGNALAYADAPAATCNRVNDLLGVLAEAGRLAAPYLDIADNHKAPAAAATGSRQGSGTSGSGSGSGSGRAAALQAQSRTRGGMGLEGGGAGVLPAAAVSAAAAVLALGRVAGQDHLRRLRAMVAAAMPAWEVRRVMACKGLGASAQAAAVLRVSLLTAPGDVRVAFRRLSLAVHPDKNRCEGAADAFALASTAAGRLLGGHR